MRLTEKEDETLPIDVSFLRCVEGVTVEWVKSLSCFLLMC